MHPCIIWSRLASCSIDNRAALRAVLLSMAVAIAKCHYTNFLAIAS